MAGGPIKRICVEELANAVTHGVGLALSILGFVFLLVLAIMRGGAWHIVGCAVYGVSLVCLYAASTLYHAMPSPRRKRALKVFDHSAIYLLIAGTYTPFLLVNLRGAWGWPLLGTVWVLAVAGILLKLRSADDFKILSPVLCLTMGWLALIAVKPLLALVPLAGVLWLFAGGLAYSGGVVFYAWKRIPYNHVIWHLFVLAGSTCHYFAVLQSVIPHAKS